MGDGLVDLVSAVVGRVHGLFIEPSGTVNSIDRPAAQSPTVPAQAREVEVAVVGLSQGCGTTTISAALALAFSGPHRAVNLVALDGRSGDVEQSRLGHVRVWQVPSVLTVPEEVAQYGGVVARVAGGRTTGTGTAATVWDLSAAEAIRGGQVLPDVDVVVALAHADSDPALADLASELLLKRCRRLLLVANRAQPGTAWDTCCELLVPESRVAKLVARGRLPGGAFGEALQQLATRVEENS